MMRVLYKVWRWFNLDSDSKVYRLAVQIISSHSMRKSLQDSRIEFARLRTSLNSKCDKAVTMLIDQRYSAPGYGDLLVCIALANVISSLGFKVNFFWYALPASQSRAEKIKTIDRFLDVSVGRVILGDGTEEPSLSNVLFRSRVIEKEDVTVPAFQLLNFIYRDNLMRRRLSRPYWPATSAKHFPRGSAGLAVGIHVRNSSESAYRNPKDEDTLKDLIRIHRQFPSGTLNWFGDHSHYRQFIERNADILSQFKVDLRFQAADGFTDAASQALSCDFWFQRWGGGIGAVILFSPVPYLMISNDVVLRRLYGIKRNQIVAWAKSNQIYELRWFRTRQKIRRRFLRFRNFPDGTNE